MNTNEHVKAAHHECMAVWFYHMKKAISAIRHEGDRFAVEQEIAYTKKLGETNPMYFWGTPELSIESIEKAR